jgi:hypothetical protein
VDEKALIAAARRGDTHSFNQLVSHYQDMVYNVAYRILGDSHAAADASQDTFLSAYQAVAKFKASPPTPATISYGSRSGVPPVPWKRSTQRVTLHRTSSTDASLPKSPPCATNWVRPYKEVSPPFPLSSA